ncbi:hypothetical protein Pst134EA_000276 [Puccinia striiformis f. sp. tritici]|uniref:uncharacterized protein n=1 Tax=Puccinia striiformis f. sp. tritici TaxID=168172 RepID=UPI002008855F|nr:uncharacterized protein Pst134EA_032821 [Puccinia striiformis f. sp. tritici]XP_047812654.1 hypothetical protein Pst134EA_000276 [Puccinia striiformis f. sp. tritici]KAH9441594.1 hypothetical protein Pst134EA_032821 [Puccinia striiformis f. sp. tritici]KAH9466443.1 hypothetical protein Pst134EB_001497 [Puccinia striiformis f. sp. tritici]KAH9473200.1 hypothetical protein Pst134EA_000276 [Puccinia striiformis f. sp. tritici]
MARLGLLLLALSSYQAAIAPSIPSDSIEKATAPSSALDLGEKVGLGNLGTESLKHTDEPIVNQGLYSSAELYNHLQIAPLTFRSYCFPGGPPTGALHDVKLSTQSSPSPGKSHITHSPPYQRVSVPTGTQFPSVLDPHAHYYAPQQNPIQAHSYYPAYHQVPSNHDPSMYYVGHDGYYSYWQAAYQPYSHQDLQRYYQQLDLQAHKDWPALAKSVPRSKNPVPSRRKEVYGLPTDAELDEHICNFAADKGEARTEKEEALTGKEEALTGKEEALTGKEEALTDKEKALIYKRGVQEREKKRKEIYAKEKAEKERVKREMLEKANNAYKNIQKTKNENSKIEGSTNNEHASEAS